jgi:hypothetical protein
LGRFKNLFGHRADADVKAFEFVYVNQDGTARELSLDERDYVSDRFHPGDSGRPYIKSSYRSRDGWGSLSGFLPRRKLPSSIGVMPVNPDYTATSISASDLARDDCGDFNAIRRRHLERQRANEERAAGSRDSGPR